ncbi:hypothetical protein DFH07DRAFT_963239 [Mycena maculata]|uniref:Uncharacterized protein n=1 Tax=Mycena maculata TaxID=230809 RepID=A0AAD7IKZ2_9AGAR|nr:hypothetical protein DFH07DRAFT_963239 [Mycena maculata]
MAALATRRLYNINDTSFKCSKSKSGCNRELRLKLCRTGKNAKRYYLNLHRLPFVRSHFLTSKQCDNPCHEKGLWFWFGAGETPSGSAASPTAAASTMTTPIPSPALPVSAQAIPTCAELQCLKTRVASLCDNKMCLAHCRARGSCRLHERELARLPRRLDPISVIGSEFDYARHPPPSTHTATPAPTPSPAPSTPLAEQQQRFTQSLEVLQADSPSTSLSQTIPTIFLCISWYTNNKPAVVEGVQTNTWPTWRRPEDGEEYAFLSTRYREWVTVRPGSDFVHVLSDEEPLFIRCPPDVVGSDEKQQLARLPAPHFPIPSPRPARKRRALHSGDDDDDEVVIVDYLPLDHEDDDDVVVIGYIPAIRREPMSPPPRTRPSLSVCIPLFYSDLGSTSESSLPGLSSSSSSAAGPSSLATPASSDDDEFPLAVLLSLVHRARKPSWSF